ncbi:polysaccharide pyruvyl transferase family protein [Marinobacter sp. chi1]|uniref:Polysaccharide pyruvyl transferase family protein n=1 Tax=Marinobacter suaedae TaxID=3057675 RepID=A0ABT8VWE0_9GAMM|nr:polysaccharide pyruvyl transferase family protein [Marinobacter sp. chi1]MDO3720306.1 polysaccharide pyruvyl transferase family protein [Marinobacter sp. chi1]
MIIEIRRAGFVNKGAELMLLAVVHKLRERYPKAKLTMAPVYGGASDTYEKMVSLQLYPKAWLWRKGFDFGRFASFVPKRLRALYGLVLTSEIDVILDVAGFAYSDQWGVDNCKELSISSSVWKKNGTKLVMLPQALGPFENENIDKYVRKWAANADLIFPRESDSYKYLTDIVGEQDKIKLYPDFTNLLEGTLPEHYDSTDKRVAIVPNYRMIDKTCAAESKAYLPFLIRTAKYLRESGTKPFLLVHEGVNDQMLAEKVSEAVGGIPIVIETNPLHIKGILGTCDATVGSRFHGLVSALSQGVPSLATGWSHKYKRLFEDYGFIEGLVSVTDSDEVLRRKVDLLICEESSVALREKLNDRSGELKRLSEEMWGLVCSVIDEVRGKKK